jgi:hypothetical protein
VASLGQLRLHLRQRHFTVSTIPPLPRSRLGNLVQVYTGASLSPTFTTSPANARRAGPHGSTIDFTTAGTYAAVVTSVSSNYPGTVSGTFTITKAAQMITPAPIPATTALKDFVGPCAAHRDLDFRTHSSRFLDAGAAATPQRFQPARLHRHHWPRDHPGANQAGNANYRPPAPKSSRTPDVVISTSLSQFTQPQ